MRNAAARFNRRKEGAATTVVAALFVAGSLSGTGALLALQALTARPACAQDKQRKREDRDEKAVKLLRRMVQAEMRKSFIAREATVNADGRGTEQWVKRDPKRGLRRESIRPPGLIWIDNYRHSYRVVPKENRVIEGESLLPRPDPKRFEGLLRRFTGQLIKPEVVGEDRVAGRSADIVAITSPATVRRFWIDRQTGLRLKTEEYNRAGKLITSSYYLSVDLSPRFAEEDFQPPRDFKIVKDDRRRFDSLAEAQKAGVKVSAPRWVPTGYNLRNVEAERDGKVTLRYANGIDVLSLTQFGRDRVPNRLRNRIDREGPGFLPFPRGLRGYVWRDGDRTFLLLSALADDQVRRIAESLR